MYNVKEFEDGASYLNDRELWRDLSRRFLRLHADDEIDAEIVPIFNRKGELVKVRGTSFKQNGAWMLISHETLEIENRRPSRRIVEEYEWSSLFF